MGGRVGGNLKHFEEYDKDEPTNVYTTQTFNNTMIEMRSISSKLGKLAYDKDPNEPSIISKAEYNDVKDKILTPKEDLAKNYTTVNIKYDSDIDNIKKKYEEFYGKKPTNKSLPKLNEDGFFQCSTTKKLSVYEIEPLKDEISKWSSLSSNICYKKEQYKYARIYVGYKDINDNTSQVFILRTVEIENSESSKLLIDKL